ncbi:MAG: NHLP leader peptide family RiPP precursor [Cyanobacteria bacterium J06636_27]
MREQITQTLEAQVINRALQDASFKRQLLNGNLAAKKAIEKEIGYKLPQDLQIKVLQETATVSYLILPMIASSEEMSEQELESVAGGVLPPCNFGSITIG